jgi:NADH-quinone oxidoreductase subunit E
MTQTQQTVARIASKHGNDRSALIPVLQDVHTTYNYLPEESLEIVSQQLNVPLSSVFGVATFFKAFSFTPRGRHLATMCVGTACHVRGARRLLEAAEEKLGISPGETTADMRLTLETVNCLGCCALGPVLVVDGEYHGEVTRQRVDSLLKDYR